jgi:hypothetical protein
MKIKYTTLILVWNKIVSMSLIYSKKLQITTLNLMKKNNTSKGNTRWLYNNKNKKLKIILQYNSKKSNKKSSKKLWKNYIMNINIQSKT